MKRLTILILAAMMLLINSSYAFAPPLLLRSGCGQRNRDDADRRKRGGYAKGMQALFDSVLIFFLVIAVRLSLPLRWTFGA